MKKTTMSVVALSVAMLANASHAAISAPSGAYIEGNVGQSYAHADGNYYDGFTSITSDSKGVGANLNVGYKFNPYFAAEAGYTYYAPTKIRMYNYYERASVNIDQYSFDVAAKGILPINNTGVELFGKLGAARIEQDVNDNYAGVDIGSVHSVSPYAALGAQYAFTSNVIGNIQYARARGNDTTGTLDLASAGISYLFG